MTVTSTEPRCGTCRYWELSSYAEREGLESGVSGHHCNGSVSNCRRHAPGALDRERYPSATARWPATEREAWCGDWEDRG